MADDDGKLIDGTKLQQMLLGLLRDALPESVPDAVIAQAFMAASEQEMKLGPIYLELLDPEKRAETPFWGLELVPPKGPVQVYIVPKALAKIEDPADMLIWMATFALLVAPVVRALLMAFGYRFQFKLAKHVKPKSPIVLA